MDCICMGKVKQAQRAHIVGSGSRVRRSGGSCVRAANLEVGARQTSNLNNIFGLYIDYREGLTGKLNSIKFLTFVQRIIEHFFYTLCDRGEYINSEIMCCYWVLGPQDQYIHYNMPPSKQSVAQKEWQKNRK